MAISLRNRIHEWLADRVPGIQYPDIRPMKKGPKPPKFVSPYGMSLFQQLFVGIIGSAVALAILLLGVYLAFLIWPIAFSILHAILF
jgi:hypothetical protein